MGLRSLSPQLEPGGLRNLSRILEIPNSAVAHWPMGQRSDSTIADEIGSNDGTANGTTNIEDAGKWKADYAEDGDGSGDSIDLPGTVFELAPMSLVFTVQSTDLSRKYWGQESGAGDQNTTIQFNRNSSGDLRWYWRDQNSNALDFRIGDQNLDDGTPHRVGFTVPSDSSTDPVVVVDGSTVSVTVNTNDGYSSPDYGGNSFMLLDGSQGSHDAIVDNFILTNDLLSASEFEDDYNKQPWS